jgi:YfiR/HmsC-like
MNRSHRSVSGRRTRDALEAARSPFPLPPESRTTWLAILLSVWTFLATPARAEDLTVPAQIQAQLIAKVAPYDRNLVERAGERVVIAIVDRPSEVDSSRAASQMQGALGELGRIAGLPHDEVIVPWTGARDLAELCTKRRFAIVYLAPGLGAEVGAVAAALEGKSVLTVASVLGYMGRGTVLGFELVSGRTKLVVDLVQAKKQSVSFQAQVLSLMRVVQ